MHTYLVMSKPCNFFKINATSPEMAYMTVCCWYSAKTRVVIMDTVSGETRAYTRRLDANGNLIEIIEG